MTVISIVTGLSLSVIHDDINLLVEEEFLTILRISIGCIIIHGDGIEITIIEEWVLEDVNKLLFDLELVLSLCKEPFVDHISSEFTLGSLLNFLPRESAHAT
jgi:hypothetical protein